MENWQIRCITKNLDKLIQTTICNVLLLANLVASNILSESDNLAIEVEQHLHDRAKKLYDFVKNRENGLSCLARALRDCKQTGALEIIKSSFLQQDIKEVLSTSCASQNVKNILARIPDSIFQTIIQLHQEEYVETFLLKEHQTEFVVDTIPNCPSYYVPRSISNRLRLDPKIFRVNCPDVFVFKDIERHELSKRVKSLGTESSGTQIDELTCKFIHLNDKADFSFMCKIRNDKPVHLVKYESSKETGRESFILEESCGKSDVLRNFLNESKSNDRCFVSEDGFIQYIESDVESVSKGYCICDSPGTGKTWLLASLARKMKTKHSDRIIVFEKVSEIDFSIGDPFDYLVNKICPNLLIKTIIKAAVKDESIKMEVFLDALDEVAFEQVQTALRFMKYSMNTSENIRLFVTSRPHMRHELESTLGAVAYDIRSFDKQNQLDFLEQYWRTSFSYDIDLSRLRDFATACQAKVQVSLSSQEKDIMGIPLQCYMLAEVYKEKAARYCKISKTTLNQFLDSSVSLFEMYERFITLKLQKLSTNSTEQIKRAKQFHIWKSLGVFSSKLADLYKHVMLQDDKFIDSEYLPYGLLEGIVNCDNRLQISFVHQTFAEYLVAEFISDILSGLQNSNENFCELENCLLEFVANEVFREDYRNNVYKFGLEYSPIIEESWPVPRGYVYDLRNKVIPFFLNEHLKFALSRDARNVIKSNTLLESFKAEHLFDVLMNCAKFGWLYLIKFFSRKLQLAKATSDINVLYRSVFLGHQFALRTEIVERPVFLFCVAAKHSNVTVFEQCVTLYAECFDYDCIDAIKRIPIWAKTPYHIALERGDYSMVEYFKKFQLHFGNRWLLHQCAGGSYDQDECKISCKIHIFSLLLNDKEHFIWDLKHAAEHGPLIKSLLATPGLHLKIIKYLVSKIQTHNIQPKHLPVLAELDFEPIKNASSYMNKTEFRELWHIFFEDLEIKRSANTQKQLADTLKSMLKREDLDYQTLQLVLGQFSSAEIFDESSTLLYHANIGNHGTEIFDLLVNHGVNLFATDKQGFCIIHYAAKCGNQSIFGYLLKKGFSVNQQTDSGKTPLMISTENCPENLLFLLKNGASVGLKDQDGETFLHKFARRLQCENLKISPTAFDELVTFLLYQAEAIEILKSNSWKQIWTAIREPSYDLRGNLRKFCNKSILVLLYKKLELDFSYCEIELNGNNILLEAIKNKMRAEVIEGLVECGANINFANKKGKNALHLAAKHCGSETVAYILNKSSLSINEKDKKGNTPLHLAKKWKIAKLLVEHGADLLSLNQKEETFAHVAALRTSETQFCKLISLLQKHTTDLDLINAKNLNGQTLLHVRLNRKYKLEHDHFTPNQIKHNPSVDVNLADNLGNTIFLLLAKCGKHWDLVKILAENGACITSKNNVGYGIVHYAAKHGNLEMVKYFHSIGLPLDDATVDGNTPILFAYKHLPVIKYLYAEGCNVNAANEKGETILQKAARKASVDTFVELALFLKKCKVTQPFVQVDLEYGHSVIHQLFYRSGSLPVCLITWIVNLPEYDICAEDKYGDTIFQTAIENLPCQETCALDAIFNTYSASVEPEVLRCELSKALTASVDNENPDAVRYLLKKGANPNTRDINSSMAIDQVIVTLSIKKFRKGYTLFQLNLILEDFLTYMLSDKNILYATDKYGNTFLHAVAYIIHPDDFQFIVAEICKKGFTDIFQIKNKSHKTPIIIARENILLTEKTLKILCQNGISVVYPFEVCSIDTPKRKPDASKPKCAVT